MSVVTNRIQAIAASFTEQYGLAPEFIVRAPGRVNLIGEHTDYNEGFVLPAAIDREMIVAATPNRGKTDQKVEIFSLDYLERDSFDLSSGLREKTGGWRDYLRGVLSTLSKDGVQVSAFKAVLSGNVPQGAGLSSSAAYEVAIATLVNAIDDLELTPKQIALLSQRAENEYIGVQCGIMDQFISALAQPDSALLIDCRDLSYKAISLNFEKRGLVIVITNSGVSRGLVDSAYNDRRSECNQGVQMLGSLLSKSAKSLREITAEEFQSVSSQLPAVIARRCRHVITENQRVISAAAALEAGDLTLFGKLMRDSHASLKDDFQVSCPELDILVSLTAAHAGTIGARMTGAGFGGCSMAIMAAESVDAFRARVIPQYEQQTNRTAEVYVCKSVAGAGKVPEMIPAINEGRVE